MKEIFQEYGGVIVTIISIVALIGVITAVIGGDENGLIGQALSELITDFVDKAGVSLESSQQ